jgi:peptidoglycan/xylan/chitin deacetylase (PgdA/CDA1 family)
MAVLWPHGARAACAFTFDLDAETLWMARGVTEPVTLSQGRFGVLDALPRILELLRHTAVRASFFVPAWVAEHYPDAIRAIVSDGHELGCHGDEHERVSDLDPAREEKILARSLEVLTRLGGRRPVGYRAPAWQFSERTLGLVARHGFQYSSNMMIASRPTCTRRSMGTRSWRFPFPGCSTTPRSSSSPASAPSRPRGPCCRAG